MIVTVIYDIYMTIIYNVILIPNPKFKNKKIDEKEIKMRRNRVHCL